VKHKLEEQLRKQREEEQAKLNPPPEPVSEALAPDTTASPPASEKEGIEIEIPIQRE